MIYISVNRQNGEQAIDCEDNNIDVIVRLKNGDVYTSPFFSYRSIETIRAANRKSGEYLNGKYFWAEGMVLVEDIKRKTVEGVVRDLIEEGDFTKVFKKL